MARSCFSQSAQGGSERCGRQGTHDLPRFHAAAGQPEIRNLVLPDGRHARAASMRFPLPGGRRHLTLVVARDTTDLESHFWELRWLLLAAGAGTMAVVFVNLLENAAECSNKGGVVRVTIRNADRFVEVEVANSGCTLTEEQVARVFDHFWRADASRKDTSLRAGLGLALVRRMVTSLGATVTAGANDQEFTVRLRLPAIS